MVRNFGFDVNAVEDNTGLNALAVAVAKRNLTLIEYLVRRIKLMMSKGIKWRHTFFVFVAGYCGNQALREMHAVYNRHLQKVVELYFVNNLHILNCKFGERSKKNYFVKFYHLLKGENDASQCKLQNQRFGQTQFHFRSSHDGKIHFRFRSTLGREKWGLGNGFIPSRRSRSRSQCYNFHRWKTVNNFAFCHQFTLHVSPKKINWKQYQFQHLAPNPKT